MDLIEEYFKRDLTEEEERLLSETLAGSPEKAGLFADRMAEFYQKDLGQTAPEWPGGVLPALKRPFAWGRWAFLALLLVGGFLGYEKFRPVKATPALPLRTTEPQASSPAPLPKAHASVPKSEKAQAAEEERTPEPVKARIRVVDSQGKVVQTLPDIVVPSRTQPDPALPVEAERLTVTLHLAKDALATVKVMDPAGLPIRTLYAGILKAGDRAFTWDGKMDNGLPAAQGKYLLEMRAGSYVQKKELRLGAPE